MYRYTETHYRDLDEDEFILFKPICVSKKMPIYYPATVLLLKKASFTETPTGRVIEYKEKAVVFLKQRTTFGQIETMFLYRNTLFAIISKYEGISQCVSGLVCISKQTSHKEIVSLEELSRPQITAYDKSELWILNFS